MTRRPISIVPSIFCCAAVMVCGGFAQNNDPPPAGAILDLANPAQPVPSTYQRYSVTFPATVANTTITFAFREDPAYISFSNASVIDLTNPGGGNLLTNGDFSEGPVYSNTPTGWTYANQYGASAGGVVDSGCGQGESVNCWYDGAVQAYDAISQTIATNVGDTYEISFWVDDNSGCGCYFSDLSTNGDTTDPRGNGIDVLVYAQAGLPPPGPNTLTVTEAGQGNGLVSDGMEGGIYCIDTGGTTGGTCSANDYGPGAQVTLTATPNSPTPTSPASTFGGWGGACASAGTSLTCTLTMNSSQTATADFNIPGPTQAAPVTPTQPATLIFSGGYIPNEVNNNSGQTFTVTEGSSSEPENIVITEISSTSPASCQSILANASNADVSNSQGYFKNASCLEIQNAVAPGTDGYLFFDVTCPGSLNGTCGSNTDPNFFAKLASYIYFNAAPISSSGENPGLYAANNVLTYGGAPYGSGGSAPLIGFLAFDGTPDPCTVSDPSNPPQLRNQILQLSFQDGNPTAKPVTGGGQGTGSCWFITYNTPNEAPTVTITQPANGGIYKQNESDSTTLASYTCTTVFNGANVATTTSPFPTAGPTGPYLTGTCSATDSPGGSVAQGSQFDTATTGPHTFTATVLDSATNAASRTVAYTVVAAPATTSANYSSFMQGTPGSFTITTTGYPVPSLSISPAGALPSPLMFTDNHNGTATISGTPTVSGLFSFWVVASNGVCPSPGECSAVQSFSLTVNPAVSFAPTSIGYGNVVVGQSAQNYVSLTNKSSKAVGIGPVTFTVTSGAKSQFSLGQACPATLQPGASCSIGAVFTPSAAGTGAATLNIPTSVSSTPQSVSLTGSGISPQASFSPTSLAFGTVKVGTKSSALSITLSNPGTSALAISSVSISGTNAGNFAKSNACPSSLAAGAKCTISVTFTPSATGARSANLTVADNASSGTQTVPLSGTGN